MCKLDTSLNIGYLTMEMCATSDGIPTLDIKVACNESVMATNALL